MPSILDPTTRPGLGTLCPVPGLVAGILYRAITPWALAVPSTSYTLAPNRVRPINLFAVSSISQPLLPSPSRSIVAAADAADDDDGSRPDATEPTRAPWRRCVHRCSEPICGHLRRACFNLNLAFPRLPAPSSTAIAPAHKGHGFLTVPSSPASILFRRAAPLSASHPPPPPFSNIYPRIPPTSSSTDPDDRVFQAPPLITRWPLLGFLT